MSKNNSINLDATWIERGLVKRKSNYSCCIVFETSDPVRVEQLKHNLAFRKEYNDHRIYIFDNWTGLRELDKKTGQTKKVLMAVEGKFGREIARAGANEIRDIKEALQRMDDILKKEGSIFIITNINEYEVKNSKLQSAIRSWAHDPEILVNDSVIFILVPDVSRIVDEDTRKFISVISVDLSTGNEREEIINYCAETFGLQLKADKKDVLVRLLAGLDIHEMDSILRESWFLTDEFEPETIKVAKTELIKGTSVLEIIYPEYGFDSVGGYTAVKKFFQSNIISALKETERAEALGLSLPRGILLFGPPGTGKTHFSKSLAREMNIPFLNFNTESIFSKWLGESGRILKQTIKIVDQIGLCILFIDEIDRLGARTGGATDSAGQEVYRVFSQLLEWLGKKDRQAIVVGTTNVPGFLDEAFVRCGRFDYKIPFLFPGKEARKQILNIHLGLDGTMKKKPSINLPEKDLDDLLENIVSQTEYFNGAELEELTNRVKRIAFNRNSSSIEKNDFDQALAQFRINKLKRAEEMKNYIEIASQLTDDQVFLDELSKDN